MFVTVYYLVLRANILLKFNFSKCKLRQKTTSVELCGKTEAVWVWIVLSLIFGVGTWGDEVEQGATVANNNFAGIKVNETCIAHIFKCGNERAALHAEDGVEVTLFAR
jgi:hypothetical protein